MATDIHPTAVVDKGARLGRAVTVGPHAVIESDVTVGDGCEIMAGAVIRRYTTMGSNNLVHPFGVLGGEPQDYKFDPAAKTYLRIGSGNIFREHVTINRATSLGGATVIGDGCYFMTQSHTGHDSVVGDRVILTNNVALAGHCRVASGAVLSANTMVHQFCWVGELVMMGAQSGISQHIPPYVMVRGINYIVGLNAVGLRRAEHITNADRKQIKEAYRLLYRSSLTPQKALAEMESRDDWGAAAGKFMDFLRRVLAAPPPYNRGIPTARSGQHVI